MTEPRDAGGRYLGVDMGGTATRAYLLQAPAAPRTWRAAGGNLALDREAALDVLLPLVRAAAPDVVCIGSAGARTAPDAAAWLADELAPQAARVTLMTDADLALMAAFRPGADGIVLCAGTGSVAIVRHRGTTHLVGGHGFLFGDAGSAYDIGRRLIASALRARDHGSPALSDEVAAMLGEPLDAFVRRAYADPGDRSLLAGLARRVPAMRHPAGARILAAAADNLVDLVTITRERFPALPVRLVGGVFRIRVIADAVRQRCGATHARIRPEIAAARFAATVDG